MELVSIIMSTYNTDENMLKESISSILNQTYENFEFIIVNDASTKNDLNIIKSFKDERIVLIENEKNIGLAASLNKAIDISKGNYIARMDSDDISVKNRIERQVKYLQENKHIDLIGTYAKHFGKNKNLNVTPLKKYEEVNIQLFTNTTLVHPTVMIRKKFLDMYKLRYNEGFKCAQDFEMWTKCSEHGKIEILPEVLLLYRVHNKQVSSEKQELQKLYAKQILERQLKKLNIDYNESEFNQHLILSGLKKFEVESIEELNKWINKLIIANNNVNLYNSTLFEQIIKNKIFNIYLKSNPNKLKGFLKCMRNEKLRYLINKYTIRKSIERAIILFKNK